MSTKTLIVILIVVAAVVGVAVMLHTPAGAAFHRSVREFLHGL